MKYLLTFISLALCTAAGSPGRLPSGSDVSALHRSLSSGCTVITVKKGDSIFFGGNDDYISSDSYYWVEPGALHRYGVVWIGPPDNPQQGVNEKLLAYDANGLPRVNLNPHPERIPVRGEYHSFIMQALHECATVEEVIAWAGSHRHFPYMHDQLQFADATGDAVIISAGKDGELVFTRKAPGDGFLVSTNFNVANPLNGFSYPCRRYDEATLLLQQMEAGNGPVSRNSFTRVMAAVHQENSSSWTIETLVVDLVNGILYLYYFYQYDRPLVLKVKEELSHPRQAGPLSRLFPEEVRKEAARRYDHNRAGIRTNKFVGTAWPMLVFISLVLLLSVTADYRKELRLWLPAVLVFGPAGIIARLAVGEKSSTGASRAVAEVAGDLVPVTIAYVTALVLLILKTVRGSVPGPLQVALMFGLPLLFGLIFHGTTLAPPGKACYGRLLLRRVPQLLTVTFLALGGIIPVVMPLTNHNLVISMILPLSPPAVLTWWAFTALGALPGGALVYLYERWAVRRGFFAWSRLPGSEEEFRTPGWRKIWWWLALSIVVLLVGFAGGVALAG